MRCNRLAGSSSIGQGQDKPCRSSEVLGQRDSLELCCPQLRLKVAKATLNFEDHNLSRALENHVSSSTIRRRGHRQLKADTPRLMCCRSDHLGEAKLARVAEPDAVGWVHADGQPMTQPLCYSGHRVQVRRELAALDPADYGLAAAGTRGQLALCQARSPAPISYVTAELSSGVGRSHLSSIGGGTHRAVTPRLSRRLLRCAP